MITNETTKILTEAKNYATEASRGIMDRISKQESNETQQKFDKVKEQAEFKQMKEHINAIPKHIQDEIPKTSELELVTASTKTEATKANVAVKTLILEHKLNEENKELKTWKQKSI